METYIEIINIVSFILFIINMLLYKFNSNCQIDNLLMIISNLKMKKF